MSIQYLNMTLDSAGKTSGGWVPMMDLIGDVFFWVFALLFILIIINFAMPKDTNKVGKKE